MAEEKKSERRQQLFYEQKNAYEIISAEEKAACMEYSQGYMDYLNKSKTERKAVESAIVLAKEKGFVEYKPGMELKPGTKIYKNNRGKFLTLAIIGKESLKNGANIAAAHIDSPRLDLKQLPLYEDNGMAFFKTHYYGGIKKYQWVTIPLALYGVIVKKDGTVVDVAIGDDPADPVLYITDLLPHLASNQMQKNAREVISGEALNLLIGSIPDAEEGKDRVKLAVMQILNEKYGIIEEDFLSAELEAVPAYPVRDIGFDRSLIGGYGHDDRVCAYAELKAIFDTENPEKTAVCLLADKEEVGSQGVSGMKSEEFELFMGSLCETQGVNLYECFGNSFCLSADVCNGLDPNYAEVSEKRNNAKLNYGMGICKFTGHGGKSGANDASAEVVGKVRKLFDENGVIWQMAELGKVDQGGGGTVASLMSNRNIDTIDAGVPVLSMHSPYEVVAKLDCYMTYKGVLALYNS